MNRELIKKYKKEFDYWLDNPDNLLFKSNIDKESKWRKFDDSGDDWTWTHHYNDKVKIVINDEYVEFRKALAEGKTIQFLQGIKNNTEWIDADESYFNGCGTNYLRVKQDA
jgi:molybdopterin converting factor small subunit